MLPVAEVCGSRRRLSRSSPFPARSAGHAPAWPSFYRDLFRASRESKSEHSSHEHAHPSTVPHSFSSAPRSPRAIAAAPRRRGGAGQGRGGAPRRRASRSSRSRRRRSSCRRTSSRPCGRCNSTTIQPQVDGRVTKIYVKSGDQVRVGTPLVQIDPEKAGRHRAQHRIAARRRARRTSPTGRPRSSACSRCSRPARSARTSSTRRSTTSTPRRRTSPRSTRRSAKDACSCSTTASPRRPPGVVGDIAIREGDRITTSTVITTVDDKAGLEAYIQVPVDRAPELKVGLADADPRRRRQGRRAPIRSRSSRRAPIPRRRRCWRRRCCAQAPPDIKLQQFVKIRVIWRSVPGADDSGHRGHAASTGSISASSPSRPATAWSRGSIRSRSAKCTATTTSSPAGSRPATA